MEKPVTMQMDELRGKITDAINESYLHPAVVEMIVGGIHAQVEKLAMEQRMRERRAYEEAEKKEGKTDGKV